MCWQRDRATISESAEGAAAQVTLNSNMPSSPENGPHVHPGDLEGSAGSGERGCLPLRVREWFFRLFLTKILLDENGEMHPLLIQWPWMPKGNWETGGLAK